MFQIQNLVRSRDSPLSIQTLILVMFIDASHYADAGVEKWQGEKCTLYKQDTKNSSVYNVCCIFEDKLHFCE